MFKKRQPSATTLVIDRISALTNNQLTVKSVWQPRLATSRIATTLAQATLTSTDPLDRAFIEYVTAHGGTQPTHQPLRQYDFTQTVGISGNLWHHGADYTLAVKGMPERIISHCDLSDNERESILLQLQSQSIDGGYIVALAQTNLSKPIKRLTELTPKHNLQFVGLVNLQVTIPSSTRQIIDMLHRTGVKTYLLTGQHPAAGYYLAAQIGVAQRPNQVLDAEKLDLLPDMQVQQMLDNVSVIARADSVQKRRILRLIERQRGQIRHARSIDELRNFSA